MFLSLGPASPLHGRLAMVVARRHLAGRCHGRRRHLLLLLRLQRRLPRLDILLVTLLDKLVEPAGAADARRRSTSGGRVEQIGPGSGQRAVPPAPQ